MREREPSHVGLLMVYMGSSFGLGGIGHMELLWILIGLATVQRGALKDSELWHTAAPCLVLRSGLGMEVCVMALMLSEIKTFGGFTEETCDLCNV